MDKKNDLKEIDLKKMGSRLRAQREAIHMTRAQLSAKLGVTSKFIGDIEYGDKGVSIQTLYKMAQVLHLSTDYILAGDQAASNATDPEIERLRENIMGALSVCSAFQLKCMEQIVMYYVEGIVGDHDA